MPLATTDQGADAGQQLGESEGLAKIIVGPAVEALDPVVHLVPGGQEDDRGLAAGLEIATEQGQAVLAGQRPIEQYQVPGLAFQHREALVSVHGVRDGKALLRQAADDEFGEIQLILDDQDGVSHESTHYWRTCPNRAAERDDLEYDNIKDRGLLVKLSRRKGVGFRMLAQVLTSHPGSVTIGELEPDDFPPWRRSVDIRAPRRVPVRPEGSPWGDGRRRHDGPPRSRVRFHLHLTRPRGLSIEDYDRALADCDEALRLDPKDPEIRLIRGLVLAIGKDDLWHGLGEILFHPILGGPNKMSTSWN